MVRVGSNYTPPENEYDGPDGTFLGTLISIGIIDSAGDFIPDGTRTFESKQWGERTVQDWTFAFENGQVLSASVGAPAIDQNGEPVIGQRSTYYKYANALFGKKLAQGVDFDAQRHLLGRQGYVTVERNENDYPRITNVGPLPTAAPAAPAPAPAAVAAPAPQPLREQVAPAPVPVSAGPVPGDLPF